MITESTFIKSTIATAIISLAGTDALVKHLPMFTDAHELPIILWIIGGMLAIIGALMGSLVWFVRDIKISNREQHSSLFEGQTEIATDLARLRGEHDASSHAQGCALDAKRLQAALDKAASQAVALSVSAFAHKRHGDCPLHGESPDNNGVGGD